MTYATETPITDADIAAFRYRNAFLDKRSERVVGNVGPGQSIIEALISFECFTFSAPELGEIVFDVRGIKDALANRELDFRMYNTPLTKKWIEHIRKNGGVEAERMKALTAADLERPPISVRWANGYTTVIDGNNRLVRRWDDGLRMARIATILMNTAMLPFICRPGKEDQFVLQRSKKDPRGMETLAIMRVRDK